MCIKHLLLLSLLAILLAGCGSPEIDTPESITFSVLYNGRKESPFREDWLVLEEYKKRWNVSLDLRIGDDANFERLIIQALESQNIPDIVLKVWPDTIESYASNGILLAFSDYENLMPNFKAYIKAHNLDGEIDKLRLNNGKYYILPGYQRKIQVQQWIYRRDIFEKNNLPAPQSYDELYDSLVLLKQLYPDTTPITADWGGAHLYAMMGAGYGISAGWNGSRYYDFDKKRWRFSPATENYKELLRFLNRCYSAGVLDPVLFSQNDAEFMNKLVDGRALVTPTWITTGFNVWNEKLKENGFPDGEWAAFPVPESTVGIRELPAVNPFRKGLIVPSRVSKEPYFEELLSFLDWAVYSEEGMTLTSWGVDGITYEQTATGKALKDTMRDLNATAVYGLNTFFDLNENEEFEDYKKPAGIVDFLDKSLQLNETADLQPTLHLDSNALSAINAIDEKINTYVAESFQHFVKGEVDVDEDWNEYVSGLEKRGYLVLEEIWNIAWKEQNKKIEN